MSPALIGRILAHRGWRKLGPIARPSVRSNPHSTFRICSYSLRGRQPGCRLALHGGFPMYGRGSGGRRARGSAVASLAVLAALVAPGVALAQLDEDWRL